MRFIVVKSSWLTSSRYVSAAACFDVRASSCVNLLGVLAVFERDYEHTSCKLL
jgi:hypothetical protein